MPAFLPAAAIAEMLKGSSSCSARKEKKAKRGLNSQSAWLGVRGKKGGSRRDLRARGRGEDEKRRL
jgi:hypothetical protein